MSNKRNLYIGGLHEQVTESILHALVLPFGDVLTLSVPLDNATQKHRGFAFVEMEDFEDAAEAKFNLDGCELFGKEITVSFAQPLKHKPGVAKAIWNDEDWLREQAGKDRNEEEPMESLKTASATQNSSAATHQRPRVFFDILIEGKSQGRIVMELCSDIVPKTVQNFVSLCENESGASYRNTIFHRIIPGFMCQGGDFEFANGTGGYSAFPDRRTFSDENFVLKHTGAGTLSMANSGPNTNGSQFFLCFGKTEWLDGKHVVFGKVVKGMEIVAAIEKCGSENGTPKATVTISNSGVY
eukprot:Sdes_comp20780_c0_seq1m16851